MQASRKPENLLTNNLFILVAKSTQDIPLSKWNHLYSEFHIHSAIHGFSVIRNQLAKKRTIGYTGVDSIFNKLRQQTNNNLRIPKSNLNTNFARQSFA